MVLFKLILKGCNFIAKEMMITTMIELEPKPVIIGMVHIPGINDLAYAKYLELQLNKFAELTHLWYQLP